MPRSRRIAIALIALSACASPAPLADERGITPPDPHATIHTETLAQEVVAPRAPAARDAAWRAHRDADWAAASQLAGEALPYYEARADFRRQIELLLMRALANRQLGERDAAHKDAHRAQQLLDATWMPLVGARDDADAGDLPYLLAQSHHLRLPVVARSRAGEVASPELLYATARAEYASFRRWDALSHLLRAQATWALDAGQLAQASASLREALALDRSRGDPRDLARDLALTHRFAQEAGEPMLTQQLARWAPSPTMPAIEAPIMRWETHAERASALEKLRALRRDPSRASRPDPALLAALEDAADLSALDGASWPLAAEIGVLLLEQGRNKAASRYLDHAIASLERTRAQLVTPRQREAHATQARDLYIAALHALVGVQTDRLSQQDYRRALRLASRVKARALLDHAHADAPVLSPAPPDLLSAPDIYEAASRVEPWLDAQRHPMPSSHAEPPERWPHKDQRVVSYLISQRVGYVWVIGPDGLAMRKIAGWDTLQPLVNAWRRTLVQPTPTAEELRRWRATAERLHVELIGPVEDLISTADHLIFAPDGPLHELPFEALVRPSRDKKPDYLLYSFETSYTPSAAALNRAPRMAPGREALILGAPDLMPDALSLLPLSDHQLTDHTRFPTLPGARVEAKRAAAALATFPNIKILTLLGPRASEAALRRARLQDLRFLHISTHGLSDALAWSQPAQPLTMRQPALLLAREPDAPEDGVLRLTEILRWRTGAELVVLSGCTTGRGWEELGAGAHGLAGAFLVAGARQVIASTWDVSDAATASLMQGFYSALARGEPPAKALTIARRQLAPHKPPFYWAAFRLIR